jgi:hypothetical protein
MRSTYVRFVTARIDERSGRRQGLFQAAGALEDGRELRDYEMEQLLAVRWWFNIYLQPPKRFSRSRRSGAAPRAICWFKSSATRHVSWMHAMSWILREHGVATEMITTARPGYVVFEDEYQVAAEPFVETVT